MDSVGGMTKFKSCILVLVFILLMFTEKTKGVEDSSHRDSWIVQTNSGPVEGTSIRGMTNEEVYVFYGIPYAEPPTGKLRFKTPQPVNQWTEILKTTKQPLPCYQNYNLDFVDLNRNERKRLSRPWTEDCLKLNIWVPKPVIQDAPVVAVFHPGYFQYGSNAYPDGSILCTQAEVIVASINYRLGAFGFLYFGVPGAPGNVGLLDQQLAIIWIHENIHNFGGKSQAVILVGAGDAGAASAGYHLLSPGSHNYFRTITVFSGAPTCDWAFQDQKKSLKKAKSFSSHLGCRKDDIEDELDCLRNAHPEDIVDADSSQIFQSSLHFKPTVDGTFITEPPLDALKKGHFKKSFILSISNDDEGSIPFWEHNIDHIPNPENGVDIKGFRESLKRLYPSLTEAGMSVVEDYYIDKCRSNDSQIVRESAVRVYSDVWVECCMKLMDELYVDNGGVVMRSVEDIRRDSDPSWIGSPHASSVEFGFGYPYHDKGYGGAEINLTRYFMGIIKDASYKKASEFTKAFPVLDTINRTYMFWDTNGPMFRSHYREDHCNLWNNIIPAIAEPDQTCDPL